MTSANCAADTSDFFWNSTMRRIIFLPFKPFKLVKPYTPVTGA